MIDMNAHSIIRNTYSSVILLQTLYRPDSSTLTYYGSYWLHIASTPPTASQPRLAVVRTLYEPSFPRIAVITVEWNGFRCAAFQGAALETLVLAARIILWPVQLPSQPRLLSEDDY
jgi:hypothetical protein